MATSCLLNIAYILKKTMYIRNNQVKMLYYFGLKMRKYIVLVTKKTEYK